LEAELPKPRDRELARELRGDRLDARGARIEAPSDPSPHGGAERMAESARRLSSRGRAQGAERFGRNERRGGTADSDGASREIELDRPRRVERAFGHAGYLQRYHGSAPAGPRASRYPGSVSAASAANELSHARRVERCDACCAIRRLGQDRT